MHNKYQTEMRVSPGWALKYHLSTFGFKTPGSMVDFYYSYYLSQLCSRLNCSHQNNSLFSNGQTCLLLDLSSSWLTWQKKSSLFLFGLLSLWSQIWNINTISQLPWNDQKLVWFQNLVTSQRVAWTWLYSHSFISVQLGPGLGELAKLGMTVMDHCRSSSCCWNVLRIKAISLVDVWRLTLCFLWQCTKDIIGCFLLPLGR